MPKDRDQLTPAEPADLDKVAPESTEVVTDRIEPEAAAGGAALGPSAGKGMPSARDELPADQADEYR
ncbi:MAG TPA: hypothetical protein VFP61_01430 [Acidimicrobiales bacterium]|nr:hypothetical protein [Acidimicrobiales bacterium]